MRRLYTLVHYLLVPFILARLLFRSVGFPAYREKIAERFGFTPVRTEQCIWIHAASVGEVQAAAPLVDALADRWPDRALLVTTTTPTGSRRVRALFDGRVLHSYAPYDLPDVLSRFLRRVRPALLIIMERELWPNLLRRCAGENVPVLLANARLSERALRSYRVIRPLMRETLSKVSRVAAQSEADAARLVQLGVDENAIVVTGNQKFDISIASGVQDEARVLRARWGSERIVWVAASTHEGEEEIVLGIYRALKPRFPSLLLVIVPRHPERFGRVLAVCRARIQEASRLSDDGFGATTEVIVGDTMGDLVKLCAACDIAFVGGSMVPAGGHNPLEAAALGRPTVFGAHMRNVRDTCDLLLSAGASRQARDTRELEQILAEWIESPQARGAAGEAAAAVVKRQRGATEKVVRMAEALLDQADG